jgi:hypothetical protein
MAGLMLAGAVVAAVGGVFKGIQANQQSKSIQKQMNSEAGATEAQGQVAANRIRARSRRMAGTQRAQFAARGVELTDSAVDVQFDSASQFEVEAMDKIWRANRGAANLRTKGNAARKSGKNQLISSGFSAAGTILGGAGKFKASQNPGFGGTSGGWDAGFGTEFAGAV